MPQQHNCLVVCKMIESLHGISDDNKTYFPSYFDGNSLVKWAPEFVSVSGVEPNPTDGTDFRCKCQRFLEHEQRLKFDFITRNICNSISMV